MKPSTRLSSAVFELTPTRTRCDLIIIANEKKEKIASGLLDPFVAHLKAAQGQIAKGGYSLLLEPETGNDAAWFTKATLERFVRFVSTPEILERVYTIDTEILQIQEAISMQRSNDIGQNIVEEHCGKPLESCEVSNKTLNQAKLCKAVKSAPNANEERAIVLYKSGAPMPEANGSYLQEENSKSINSSISFSGSLQLPELRLRKREGSQREILEKTTLTLIRIIFLLSLFSTLFVDATIRNKFSGVYGENFDIAMKVQLLKVLETCKTMLQKEQGMAFARAAAAGFDIDHMAPLVSFAECFGAVRLMEACLRFIDLWKSKHESGEWLDIEASEALSTRSDFLVMTSSGIVLSATRNKHDESNHELASEDNGKSNSTYNTADDPASSGQQEYFQGQFPHIVFPPWHMHALPGAQTVFQAYPVQGVPYYHTYTGDGPFLQPPHHRMEHPQLNVGHQPGQKMQSIDGRDSNNGSETCELDRRRSLDDMDVEVSHRREPQKAGVGSSQKKSGIVVIRNINYITSREHKSGGESNSDSDSDIDKEYENFEADEPDAILWNSKKSYKSKGNHLKSVDNLNSGNDEVSNFKKDTGDGQWQAFQICLLREGHDDAHAGKEGMLSMEKDAIIKRHVNTVSVDPLALGARDTGMSDIYRICGSTSRRLQGSEINGSKILSRTSHEDFIVGSQPNQENFRNASDPLALTGFDGAAIKFDRESTVGTADETFIVPFRSMSIDQFEEAGRTAIDVDSEIPLSNKKLDSDGNRNKLYYEPDDLSLTPERETEKRLVGYEPALDYEMQVHAEGLKEKVEEDVTEMKGGLMKSDKDGGPKVPDSVYKQRTGGPLTKGKPMKMTPAEDARARAERLRSYKADLQKMKKEKEEAEVKRLESLRLERQRRIAARGCSTAGKSILSPQTKQFPAKLSPASARGSKFSDSEPGSSSPLQRSKIRTSLGSHELLKASKASKLSEGSHMAGNRLTRSSSSLPEIKRASNGGTPDSKASMAWIKRLSEPNRVTNPLVTSAKVQSAETLSKQKLFEGPERNKISAIIDLDRSKAATLPELRIKMSKSQINACEDVSVVKDQKVSGINLATFSENAERDVSNCSTARQVDADDNPIVEKTVVMLEYEKSSRSNSRSLEVTSEVRNQRYDDYDKDEKSEVIPELAPSLVDGVDRDPINCQFRKQLDSDEVRTAYSEKDPPHFANITTTGEPYQDPSALVSSMGNTGTGQLECGKAPKMRSELISRVEETFKAHVPEVKAPKMDKNPLTSVKTLAKEPSKGLRRLLKFGKKTHSSLSVDQSFDSDCVGTDVAEHEAHARNTASTSEVRTLMDIILQDETSNTGNASQKISRHLSLLSPFRIKASEKKRAS